VEVSAIFHLEIYGDPGQPRLAPLGMKPTQGENMKIVPINDRIVVRRAKAEEMSPGGIFLPSAGDERPEQGFVIEANEYRRNEDGMRVKMSVAPGDRILFGKYAGQPVKVDGEEVLILREEDVLAKLTA
jgi:chaperonin GroES